MIKFSSKVCSSIQGIKVEIIFFDFYKSIRQKLFNREMFCAMI